MKMIQLIEEKKNQIYFIELNKDIEVAGRTIKKGLDLPVDDMALKSVVQEKQGFDFKRILKDMCLLIGLDPTFKHNPDYIDIIKMMVANPYEYCLHLGVNASQFKYWVDAMAFFKASLSFSDNPLDGYFNLGKVYYSMHTQENAIEGALKHANTAFTNAKDLSSRPEINYYLTFIAYNQERYTDAMTLAKDAIDSGLKGEYLDDLLKKMLMIEDKAKYQMGYKYVLEERYQEALEHLLSISETGEDDWRIQFFTGLAYRGQGRVQDSIMHFNKARDLNQIEDQIYNELGISYMLLGDYEAAKVQFMEGLSHKPLNGELLCNLGILHIETGQIDLADKFISEAENLLPNDPIVLQTRQYLNEYIGGLK